MNTHAHARPARTTVALLIVCLVALRVPSLATAAEKPSNQERWFSVLMDDKPAGSLHMTVRQEKVGGPIVSSQRMKLSIRRGPAVITIEQGGTFTESADGKAISAGNDQTFGGLAITKVMTFTDKGVETIATQGGVVQETTTPLPEGDWLTPAAASRYVEKQFNDGEKTITFRTMDPSMGAKVIEMTKTHKGTENIDVLGKTVPAHLWETRIAGFPVVSLDYADASGTPLKSTVQMMGIKMTIVAADKEVALAEVSPPELLAQTLIKPDKPIKQPRKATSAVYELHIAPGEGGQAARDSLVSTGYQRVVWGDENTARVVLDLGSPVPARNDLPKDVHKQPSTSLNSDDPRVRELVDKALNDDALRKAVATAFKEDDRNLSNPAKAEILRRFVHTYIDAKDLEVGFATASEVARTGKGDCTEHGVLLAAMLRAAGIPSRTATGVIYVDQFIGQQGVFGYHMWTQAWLEAGPADAADAPRGGRWVDLDATLPQNNPFDATHITLATSALSEGVSNDMVAMVGMIGKLTIKVITVD